MTWTPTKSSHVLFVFIMIDTHDTPIEFCQTRPHEINSIWPPSTIIRTCQRDLLWRKKLGQSFLTWHHQALLSLQPSHLSFFPLRLRLWWERSLPFDERCRQRHLCIPSNNCFSMTCQLNINKTGWLAGSFDARPSGGIFEFWFKHLPQSVINIVTVGI